MVEQIGFILIVGDKIHPKHVLGRIKGYEEAIPGSI
jgi:hypothetical protein